MSLANKFNIPPALFETIKKMNEGNAEYQAKVKALMAKRGIKSLADLSPEEKKDFFNTLDSMHKAKNEEVEINEVKVGDKVHLGLKQKGGSGMRGTVHKIEGDTVHVNVGKEKFGDRIVKGSMKNVTKEEIELDEAIPKSTSHALVHSSSKKIIAKGNKAEMMKKMKELNAKEKGSHYLGMTHRGKVGDTFGEEVELEEGKSSTGYELYHKDFSSAMQHAYDFAKKKYNIEIDPTEIDRNVAMGPKKPSSGKANAYRLLDKTGKKAIQVQVANLDNKRYELNMYKEEVEELDELKVSTLTRYGTKATQAYGRNPEKDEKRLQGIQRARAKVQQKTMKKEDIDLDEAKSKESKDTQKQKPLTPAEKKDLSKISGIMAKQRKQLSRLREEEELTESHFKVGDEVVCKKSGMEGEVIKLDDPQEGKYYTVKREDGKTMKYAPDELKKEKEEVEEAKDEGASKEKENAFHKKLDKLVHKTFGKRPEEMKEEQVMVCKDCGDEFDKPTTDCPHDSHDPNGSNWVKKEMNEEIEELDEGLSAAQIKTLRDAYAKIDKIDVSGQAYKNLVAFLDKQDLKTLKMLAGAKIKFISGMAQNRVVRKMNESIGSTVGGALGQYAGSKMGLEGPGRAHGENLGRALEYYARLILHKLTKEEIEQFENESEELNEDLMKLDPITNTLVAAAVGIGITMSTLKYWFGPREDLRKPIEKGLDKAKKDGNAKLYHSLAAKYWEDIANDYQKKLDSLRKNPESVYKRDNPKTGAKAGDLKKFERLMQDEFIKDIKRYKEKAKEFSAKERSGEPISKKYYESFEYTQIDEVSADAAKRVAQARDKDFRKGTPTETQKRRMGRGDWRADPSLHADKARQSAEKRGAKDVYDYNKKEEVEFDEASNPQISMKRAGLSVERAKEVMRHQKEIGSIRKKREALRNSFDPSIVEAYKKMKGKKKNEVTKDDDQIVKSSDKLSGKQEPIELDPELKEQKT